MIRKTMYMVVCCSLFVSACKKEIDGIPDSNDPIYAIQGTIDGEEIAVEADGVEANFIYSSELIHGVKFFKGKLLAEKFELEFGLFDGNIDKNELILSDISQIQEMSFARETSTDLFYVSKYFFDTPEFISSIDWYVDGVFYSTDEISIKEPGKYLICAEFNFLDQTQKTVCNEIIVGYKRGANFSLQSTLNDSELAVWVSADPSSLESVDWYFDGKFISNGITFSGKIDKLIHEVKAEILFKNGTRRTRTILIDGNQNEATIRDFASRENLVDNIHFDFTGKITYHENGIDYSSLYADNTANKITISKIDYLGKDEFHNDVFLISGFIKASLKSKQNNDLKDLDLAFSWGIILK